MGRVEEGRVEAALFMVRLGQKIDTFYDVVFVLKHPPDAQTRLDAEKRFLKACSGQDVILHTHREVSRAELPPEILEKAGKLVVRTLVRLKKDYASPNNRTELLKQLALNESLPMPVRTCALEAHNSIVGCSGTKLTSLDLKSRAAVMAPSWQIIQGIQAGKVDEKGLVKMAGAVPDESVLSIGAAAREELVKIARQKAARLGLGNRIAGDGVALTDVAKRLGTRAVPQTSTKPLSPKELRKHVPTGRP